ncbi:MAG: sensor histidine kinase [bacterium]|nr:sensor histidine kinase [bacterium]
MFFKSLKKEILVFTLGITILTILITAALGASSTQTAGSDAQAATGLTLREQAEESLVQITEVSAEQQDLVFQQTRDEANNLAAYTANLYNNPTVYSNNTYWDFDTRVIKKNGRYVNNRSDISTIFIPNFVTVDFALRRGLEINSHLDFVAPSVLKSNENAVAIYMISNRGISRYFPNIVLGDVAPPEHDSLQDPVYIQGTPEKDPEKKVVWSSLYDDPAARGLMITATAPVYSTKGFEGVIGIDILLNQIIANIISYSPVEGSYAFLIDNDGEAIAFPDKAYQDILGRSRNAGEVRTDLASSSPEFLLILKEMAAGKSGFGSIYSGERELFIAHAPLTQTGFTLGVVAEASVMLKAVDTLNTEISSSVWNNIVWRVVPAGLFLIFVASLISVLIVSRIAKPVQELTEGAHEIGKGNFDYRLNVHSKNEIGELAVSFGHMSQALKKANQELLEYSRGLEEKVKERTQSLSEANAQQENLLHFISHEIKGYLTKGEGAFAGIAAGDYGNIAPTVKELASGALLEMRKGVATIMDILNAANLKKGTVSFRKDTFDFKASVVAVEDYLRPTADEKHLTLDIVIGEGDYAMEGDEEKIHEHVLRNLIDNAIRYTPSGNIRVKLSRLPAQAGKDGTIIFSVQDSGVGITPEDMAHLFTEGGHGKDSTKVNVHSTGYGLFIAKQVVEAHGGKIWAESEGGGKGSCFIVELPTHT